MEWPKRARTADWKNGVLTLDGEKRFEIPELTMDLMERLASYVLVGFHVKGRPVTDTLLAPFARHKSMVNFGVEDGALTDACFPAFSAMPKLRYLLLDGNAAIHGDGLAALQNCKLDLLTLNRTGLDDAGLLQAAFKSYWAKRLEEDPDIDPYNDLFCDLLEKNAKAHPKYQGDYGDWLNWTVPDTDCDLPIFASGWGDGYYPVYFGYDAKGEICAVYVRFIDIEASYKEQV